MKKLFLLFVLLNLFLYSQNNNIELPTQAKNFINKNFPASTVVSSSLYENGAGYDVEIDYGFNIIFYNTGLWKSVDLIDKDDTNKTIPRSVMHKSMINVIDNKYAKSKLIFIERRNKNFFVVLNKDNNNIEIEISGYGIIISENIITNN